VVLLLGGALETIGENTGKTGLLPSVSGAVSPAQDGSA
jgi:hypothetical protein